MIPVSNNIIGNYYLIHNYGKRAYLNTIIDSKSYKINPKHVLDRHSQVLRNFNIDIKKSPYYFSKTAKQIFINKDVKKRNIITLFPDARTKDRSINGKQINELIEGLPYSQKIVIISDRNFNINNKYRKIKLILLPRLSKSIEHALSSKLVLCADSFMGQMSSLLGINTFVIYNNPKFEKYCEYWGPPFNNVIHYENGNMFKMGDNYKVASQIKCDLNCIDLNSLF